MGSHSYHPLKIISSKSRPEDNVPGEFHKNKHTWGAGQDRILDSKQEENGECGGKKTNNTFSNWATVQIFMRNTMLSHNQRETEAILKQYSIDAGEQFTSAEIVGEIQTQIWKKKY